MSNAFDLQMILTRILGAAPFLIVALVGVVLCMVRQSRPVLVRIAVGCALALQLASHLVLPFLYQHIMQFVQMNSASGGGSGAIIINLIAAIVSATALGLLLFAAFSGDARPPEPSQN